MHGSGDTGVEEGGGTGAREGSFIYMYECRKVTGSKGLG